MKNFLLIVCAFFAFALCARIVSTEDADFRGHVQGIAADETGIYCSFSRELLKVDFAQGDIVTTIIKCAHGETITLTLDTTLPRYYCRGFTVRGTKGMYEEANGTVLLDPEKDEFNWKDHWGCADNYRDEWEHPIWKNFLNDGVRGGHGGMDWLVFTAFFESIERGIAPPIDTYDAAAWMAITPLSEQSIAMGGAPVAIPDFTRGAWCDRKFEAAWEYDV